MKEKFDLKYIGVFFVFLITFGAAYWFRQEVLDCITYIFNIKCLTLVVGSISAVTTLVYKIKHRKITLDYKMSFSDFKVPFEEVVSFVSNPVIIVCSLSLAKNWFLQFTNQEMPFPKFTSIEMWFIFVLSIYLLYISIMEWIKNLSEIFLKEQKEETPQPTEKPADTSVVKPK